MTVEDKRSGEDAYADYLETNAWRAKRRMALERAAGLCERCRQRDAAHVHHLTYERLGKEHPGDLLAVCVPCHDYLEGYRQNDPARGKERRQRIPGGWVQLPRRVLFDPDLSDGAKVLYAALLSYAWQSGECWAGHRRLADDLHITQKTIRDRFLRLRRAGYVTTKQRGNGRTALHTLLPIEEADE